MTDRRYSDDEVRRMLMLAAEAESAAGADPERPWTLAEVERIGAEAGLAPEAVAAAALVLDRQPSSPVPASYFGLPVAVSRSVPLRRHLSDDDWQRLVAELRDTFAARGRESVAGARREWRVGNLRVTHEPAGSGAVLQLRTRKGDARVFLQMGVALLLSAVAAVVVLTMAANADVAGASDAGSARRLALAWMLGVGGLSMLLVGVLRLPTWARQRTRQFASLAAFARRIAAS
jgi:hypothetical protein